MTLLLNGTNGVSDVDGSASTPAIRGTDTNTGIFFPAADTIAFAEGGAESMRLDSNGNVGIGTSSPTGKLHTYAAGSSLQAIFEGTTLSPYIQVKGNSGSTLVGNESTGGWVGTISSQALAFKTNDTERMRIDSSGNLLAGTTTQLDYAKFTLSFSGATNNGIIYADTTASGTSSPCIFKRAGTNVGAINTTASATSYVTSSDYRLKENIAPMTGALAKVSALKPVTYTWKSDGSDGQGFIAHELAEVVPDCVTGEKDAVDAEGNPVYQGIDTSFLVATLTASIQELKAIVDAQAERISVLENNNVGN